MDHQFDDTLLPAALSADDDDSVLDAMGLKNYETDASEKVADVFSQEVPANAKDLTSVDTVIASQMSKLSVDDRERVYMDAHGVSDYYLTETPELIHLSLLDLQNEIDLLPDKEAYNRAERLGREYGWLWQMESGGRCQVESHCRF